jgi:hypothetical protein
MVLYVFQSGPRCASAAAGRRRARHSAGRTTGIPSCAPRLVISHRARSSRATDVDRDERPTPGVLRCLAIVITRNTLRGRRDAGLVGHGEAEILPAAWCGSSRHWPPRGVTVGQAIEILGEQHKAAKAELADETLALKIELGQLRNRGRRAARYRRAPPLPSRRVLVPRGGS